MRYQTPTVLKVGSRYAILLTKGKKLYEIIEMESLRLMLRKKSQLMLDNEGYVPCAYNLETAAKHFLKHHAGLSPNAQTALEKLVDDAWLL